MIVENSKGFSPQLIRSELFTRPVEGLDIHEVVRQIVERFGHDDELASRPFWIGIEGMPSTIMRLMLKRRSCRFGGYRWSAICPRRMKNVAKLYLVNYRLACRSCHRLKYMSHICSDAPRLMHHYAHLRERFESRPGPKPRRYWQYLAKEDFYVRRVIEGLQKHGRQSMPLEQRWNCLQDPNTSPPALVAVLIRVQCG